MNCCLQNICYINLHILYIYQVKTKIQELQGSNKYIKSYQQNKFESLDNIILLCISYDFQANWVSR